MKLFNKLWFSLIYVYIFSYALIPSKIYNIPFGDALLALIFFLYAIKILIDKDDRNDFKFGIKNFFNDYLCISFMFLIIIMFVSVAFAFDKKLALSTSLRFLSYLILFFTIKYGIKDKKIINNMFKYYIALCVIVCLIGIFQYFTGNGMIEDNDLGAKLRIQSTLENSNNLGIFLIFPIFPIILLSINERIKSKKIIYSICGLIMFINIILTQSRNAWAGLIFGCIIFTLFYSRKFIFVLLGGGLISLTIKSIRNRIVEFGAIDQNVSRIRIWKIALKMIKEHPIMGIGNGNFKTLYLKYAKNDLYDWIVRYHAHNVFLNVQCELGILGTISFIILIISIIIKIKRFINSENNEFNKIFYKGFYISIIVFILMNMIDNFFITPKVIGYFWMLIAVMESIVMARTRNINNIKIEL